MRKQLLIRRSHRYLGLVIGIQFLLWTLSGLYFSWNDLDGVHGDHMRKLPRAITSGTPVAGIQRALLAIRTDFKVDSIQRVSLISVAGKPLYQIAYYSGSHAGHGAMQYALADGQSGQLRGPLSKEEAVLIARDNIAHPSTVLDVRYLKGTGKHHEYRGRPLPAWEVRFSDPACTAYISAERGTFQAIRHDQWRAFDFLWMFHTMDYESRDDFNNWLLRLFSVLGLATVISGFALFFVSSRLFRTRRT